MTEPKTSSQPKTVAGPIIEDQGQALLQAVPDLVFFLGIDGTYIDIFSAAAEDLFAPREALIGRTVLEVLPPPVGQDCMDAINKLKTPKDVSTFSYELTIEEQPRWFEGRITLCGTDSVIVLVRDFTEQRLAEQKLRNANTVLQHRAEQLQRLEQELTRAEQRERRRMAQLLHDNLQQLLVGAKLNLSILGSRLKDDQDRTSAKDIQKVLDDALHQSQMLTADLCPPILYEGSLEQFLEWLKNHATRLYGLTVNLAIDAGSATPSDDSIRFIIFNAIQELLLNVVKHSGTMEASISVSTQYPGCLKVIVSDKGQGFSPSLVDSTNVEAGGYGLFTLQERVSWLGGEITIESEPDAGCKVSICLPVINDTVLNTKPEFQNSWEPLINEKPVFEKEYRVRGKGAIRVLLADDHAVLREGLVGILLQDEEFSVVGEASDGETAVNLANKLNPNVVLMDVMMPGMGGAEATRLIRQSNPDIQIIALSMYEEHERGDEMRAAGASEYITKSEAALKVADAIRACCKIQPTGK